MMGLASVVFATLAMGCSTTPGSGIPGSETRMVAPFDEVDTNQVNMRIVVDPTSTAGKLELSGDDNLVRRVRTRVEGHRLEIEVDAEGDIEPRVGLEVIVTVPTLTFIHADASARVDVTTNNEGKLVIEATGGARVTGHGKVGLMEVDITGGADLRARELVARDVNIDASGGATATVCATQTLDADLNGAADVSYYCDPYHVEREVGGNSHLHSR
jgi:hypothetical protein